jgi:hypothetical protein
MSAPAWVTLGFVCFVLFALSYGYGVEHGGQQPIECKTPIEPDLVIVVSGGELDTTYVYRRN